MNIFAQNTCFPELASTVFYTHSQFASLFFLCPYGSQFYFVFFLSDFLLSVLTFFLVPTLMFFPLFFLILGSELFSVHSFLGSDIHFFPRFLHFLLKEFLPSVFYSISVSTPSIALHNQNNVWSYLAMAIIFFFLHITLLLLPLLILESRP